MGGGGGPTLNASLSRGQDLLAGTTTTTATQSVAFFGFGSPFNGTVDTFDGNNDLARETLTYKGNLRSIGAATNMTCGNDSYALFGGGEGATFSNDVDIFKCNDDGVFNDVPLQQFTGPGRSNLAATSVTCGNDSYALFGGGFDGSTYSNDVDIFKCNDDGVFYNDTLEFNGPGREQLAATSVTCGNASYALFGGGIYFDGVSSNYSNDVDIFKCNDDGVFYNDTFEFNGPPRYALAATSVTCGNDSYALFGGGFGGSGNFSNDVDIFKCNDDGLFYHNTLHFNGPPRSNLAATTVRVDGKEYALFAGGSDDSNTYDTIDIYDCETEQFLPL